MKSLVLIHGFTGSPASFEEVERHLDAERWGWRVFRPPLLGHEACAHVGVDRFEREVDRVGAEILRHGARGAHLCGYSLGARVALGLLARHPFLFSGATLIGVHPGLQAAGERCERTARDEHWCELLLRGGMAAFVAAWENQPLFASRAALPGSRQLAQRRIRSSHSGVGLMRALRVLGLAQMPNYRGVLEALRFPVQLLAGGLDAKFVALARELSAANDRVQLEIVQGAGHDLLLEAPERVAVVLTRAMEA